MDRSALAYWETLAGRWRIAPPLAPCGEDIAYYEARVPDLGGGAVDALLLGVTPAIATMCWPAGTSLVAVDWAMGMIRAAWPKEALPPGAAVVRGDWRELPFAAASRNFVIGDGCYTVFRNLECAALMNREVRRVLRPGGLYCLRCFCRPDRAQPPAQLFAELRSGRLGNLDLFRWLLAMSLQGNSPEGVSLREVWRTWRAWIPDPQAERNRLGWSEDALANMERWGTLEAHYSFPRMADLLALAEPHFDLVACDLPGYPWGERFPRLLMRARG